MDSATRTRDEWLALRCQSSEPGAFEALVASLERPLLYYTAKLTGSEDTALEVLQEVWIRAFAGISRLKDPGSLRSWLYRITHAAAVDRVRHDRSRERAEEGHTEELEQTVDPNPSGEEFALVHQALDELELRHREVLTLHFLEDFSIAEIASVIGCAEGTVKSRIHYAKQAMREILTRGGYGTR